MELINDREMILENPDSLRFVCLVHLITQYAYAAGQLIANPNRYATVDTNVRWEFAKLHGFRNKTTSSRVSLSSLAIGF